MPLSFTDSVELVELVGELRGRLLPDGPQVGRELSHLGLQLGRGPGDAALRPAQLAADGVGDIGDDLPHPADVALRASLEDLLASAGSPANLSRTQRALPVRPEYRRSL